MVTTAPSWGRGPVEGLAQIGLNVVIAGINYNLKKVEKAWPIAALDTIKVVLTRKIHPVRNDAKLRIIKMEGWLGRYWQAIEKNVND